MGEFKRTPDNIVSQRNVGNGPYLARVVGHLDPTLMGGLEVTLLRDQGNILAAGQQTFIVRCATPFFGYTNFEFMGKNKCQDSNGLDGFNDTQKSYGMWMVPPDVGVTVMVVFIDGDPAQGYWIACIPSRFANHMVPAIAGSEFVDISDADRERYDTDKPLPVAEYNRKINAEDKRMDVDRGNRPLHPTVESYYTQGLLEDSVRGVVNSTPRRDVPSSVFGISTPGPLDRRPGAKKAVIGKIDEKSSSPVFVSRLGGTQLVMDDGDDRFQRKDRPGKLKFEDAYADYLGGEDGDPTIPASEYFRIRTRTGHQILLHNSEDLVYITNSQGTSWIELTSNGKIDVYSKDSVSVHTENDINLRADRDINIEAGRNINMKATGEYLSPGKVYDNPRGSVLDDEGNESGRIQIESRFNFNLLIGRNGKIQLRNEEKTFGNLDIAVMGDMRITVRDPDISDSTSSKEEKEDTLPEPIEGSENAEPKGLHIRSFDEVKIFSEKNLHLKTATDTLITSKINTNIRSGELHRETASKIHMNGPEATEADFSTGTLKIKELPVYENVKNNTDIGWKTMRFKDKEVKSIMKRMPMHEPWSRHENLSPEETTPAKTDREIENDE
jgi:hypothetical protein